MFLFMNVLLDLLVVDGFFIGVYLLVLSAVLLVFYGVHCCLNWLKRELMRLNRIFIGLIAGLLIGSTGIPNNNPQNHMGCYYHSVMVGVWP